MFWNCFNLFFLFSKIGLFSIGGGYVMLPMMRRELVEKRNWLSDQELLDYYALSQAVPGIIATNTSTFVGFRRAGFIGAFSATAGMIFPSLVVIIAIAVFFCGRKPTCSIRANNSSCASIRMAVKSNKKNTPPSQVANSKVAPTKRPVTIRFLRLLNFVLRF